MKPEEKVERAALTKEIMTMRWFKVYFEPMVKDKVENALSIKHIDENNIENSYRKKKLEADIYLGIMNMLNSWVSMGERSQKFVEEDKDNG